MARRSVTEILKPEVRADLYGFYDELRSTDPFMWDEPVQAWVVTDYDTVAKLASGRQLSSVRFRTAEDVPDNVAPVAKVLSRWMFYMDAPDHGHVRSLVARVFTPRAVEGLRAAVVELVDDLLEELADDGEMDLIADLAYPLPLGVICQMFGIPLEDGPRLYEWAALMNTVVGNDTLTDPDAEKAVRAVEDFTRYLNEFLDDKMLEPKEGLLFNLMQEDRDGNRLTRFDVVASIMLLVTAGHATTTNLIGNGILALLSHRDELDRLRREPDLIHPAIEEILRYDSPVQGLLRRPMEDVELEGRTVSAGAKIFLVTGAANRDPASFSSPNDFDLSRKGQRHFSFGHGPHFCVGAALARMEAEIAISTLLSRFPGLHLSGEPLTWKPNLAFRELERLHLAW